MISFEVNGSSQKLEKFLTTVSSMDILFIMSACGQEGVNALALATPIESQLAAHSWSYLASRKGGVYELTWMNSDVENGFPVAIMLQYGYGTGTGGFVAGRDYINPAVRPVFDKIADKVWKAVTSA